MEELGVCWVNSIPYWPELNLAEKFIKALKGLLRWRLNN